MPRRQPPPRRAITSRKQWEQLSPREQETYERVLEAVAVGRREHLSARRAAKRAGTTVQTMKRYSGDTVHRPSSGRLMVADADRLFRRMRVQTTDGLKVVDVRGSRTASRIAAHHAAVDGYLKGGSEAQLHRFRNLRVGGHLLETDPDALEAAADRDEVRFEDLYAKAA
jgi:hypothetical protein